jgi:hypothetical protein
MMSRPLVDYPAEWRPSTRPGAATETLATVDAEPHMKVVVHPRNHL